MDYFSIVFKDPSKLLAIIEKGYKVVVMGDSIRMINAEIGDTVMDMVMHGDLPPRRLWFVFDNVEMQRTGENFGCISSDLEENGGLDKHMHTKTDKTGVLLPYWAKMRVETNYPFECYLYRPGNLVVDGLCVQIDSPVCAEMVAEMQEGLCMSYSVLNYKNITESKLWLKLDHFDLEHEYLAQNTHMMNVSVQNFKDYEPLQGIIYT